jgi:hypothetical protein
MTAPQTAPHLARTLNAQDNTFSNEVHLDQRRKFLQQGASALGVAL